MLKRLLGREARIPRRMPPGAAGLIRFPGDERFPEIGDERVLVDALAWRRQGPGAERGARDLTSRTAGPPIRNVVLVSHCDFTGNSALHVHAIASELHRRGLSPAIAVPDHAESVDDIGRPPFPVLTYAEVLTDALRFPDGRGPDLVHAFSPRELVREVTIELLRLHDCRYVLHLEDNDEVVLSGELGGADAATLRALPLTVLDRIVQSRQAHPLRAARFLERASGCTVLIDRLLELVPAGVPSTVVQAGFDEAVLSPCRPREEVRAELGLEPDELAIVYTGTIHSLNRDEMRSLYEAVASLRRDGRRVVLVKTGSGSDVAAAFPSLGAGIRDLGLVPRSSIPEILAAADILVQPGGPSLFNDYRFPAKLPEYLVSGRPVVLPRTNVGLELRDGEEALLLDRGDATEISAAVARLADDADLRSRLGVAGRAFAMRELRWAASVDRLEELFAELVADGRPASPAWALDGADPPARLLAIVPDVPTEAEAQALRANGIYGLCLETAAILDLPAPLTFGFPFCLSLDDAAPELVRAAGAAFASPGYIRIDGAPLLFGGEGVDADRLTEAPVHLARRESPEQVRLGRGASSGVEPVSSGEGGYAAVMRERLAAALPGHSWFRALVPPTDPGDAPVYEAWLRKLLLQTALRAPGQPPFLVVDAAAVWSDPARREAWLEATRSGLRDGVRQFYASQRLAVSAAEAERILGAT